MRRERIDHTLQPTALIHEAYLRLVETSVDWQSRAHFIGVAAKAMRRILVDHARAHLANRRGGEYQRVEWNETIGAPVSRAADLIDLDEVLGRLEKLKPRQAKVVELRYIGGLSFEEVASVMDLTPRTIKRDWALARIWLYNELRRREPEGSSNLSEPRKDPKIRTY